MKNSTKKKTLIAAVVFGAVFFAAKSYANHCAADTWFCTMFPSTAYCLECHQM